MRDGPPPRNRAVGSAVFLDRPPIHEGREKGTANASQPKRNAYFPFKLLIINDINQYFNIHLHLISLEIKHILHLQCEITILTNKAC